MPDDVKSRIEELERELYSKDFKPHVAGDVFTRKDVPVAHSWDAKNEDVSLLDEAMKLEKAHHSTIMKRFAQFSVIFFVLAVLISGIIWFQRTNVISGDKISVDIDTPLVIAGGEPFATKFVVTNNNKVPVESAVLLIEYPVGFYSAIDKSELLRTSKKLGTLTSGQVVTESVDTILYGEENTTKDINVTLEYRIEGSNATLRKTANYSVKISSSPINIRLDVPKDASSGQEVNFTVVVGSNSKDPITSLIMDVAYPFGFTFKSADPAPTYGTNRWQVSGLAPEETRTIKIKGIIEGQENEEKITKISVGTQSPKDERFVGVVYNAITESTIMTKPFLELDVLVNGQRGAEHVVTAGRGARVDVHWKSNNQATVNDTVFEVKLKGEALNRYSVFASGEGFYRSIDDTIVWDKTVNSELRTVDPGENGSLSFSFLPRPAEIGGTNIIKNPQITFEVSVRAKRTMGTDGLEDITTFASRTVKFATEVRLGVKSTYFSGPFKNTGPLPPKVDRETTYTISFTARNSSNSVSNAVVKTTLPTTYVKWIDSVYPEGESIIYNEATSEVSWNAGRIPAGGSREASFQVSFLPSLSQINQSPKLTGDSTLTATDDFTKLDVGDQKGAVTTYLSSDPQAGQNQSSVVN